LLLEWISLILCSRNLTAWRRALRDSWAFKYLVFHCESNNRIGIEMKKKMRRKWKLVTTYLVTTSVNGFHVQRCCNSFFNVYFISSSSFFIIFFSKCYSFFLSFIFWVFYIYFLFFFFHHYFNFVRRSTDFSLISIVIYKYNKFQFASIKNKFSFTNSRFIYFVSPSNVTLIVANLYVRGGHK
jgi:hypothetical protein